jgi:hypothetical protein
MWTLEMSNLARQAKHFYWKWKNEGGNNRESDSYRKMRDIQVNFVPFYSVYTYIHINTTYDNNNPLF